MKNTQNARSAKPMPMKKVLHLTREHLINITGGGVGTSPTDKASVAC